jgi:hypothetical protein
LRTADGDKEQIGQIKAFDKKWFDLMQNCDARIKTLRGVYEWLMEKTDKMKGISLEMVEKSEKTAVIENQRKNLSPVFSGKFIEKMTETKAKADQDLQDAMVAEIKQNVQEATVLVR